MPRDGDFESKLTVLRVKCVKCGRSGQYQLKRLLRAHGRNSKVIDWLDVMTADCPKKSARNVNDQCGAKCPDLPKVL